MDEDELFEEMLRREAQTLGSSNGLGNQSSHEKRPVETKGETSPTQEKDEFDLMLEREAELLSNTSSALISRPAQGSEPPKTSDIPREISPTQDGKLEPQQGPTPLQPTESSSPPEKDLSHAHHSPMDSTQRSSGTLGGGCDAEESKSSKPQLSSSSHFASTTTTPNSTTTCTTENNPKRSFSPSKYGNTSTSSERHFSDSTKKEIVAAPPVPSAPPMPRDPPTQSIGTTLSLLDTWKDIEGQLFHETGGQHPPLSRVISFLVNIHPGTTRDDVKKIYSDLKIETKFILSNVSTNQEKRNLISRMPRCHELVQELIGELISQGSPPPIAGGSGSGDSARRFSPIIPMGSFSGSGMSYASAVSSTAGPPPRSGGGGGSHSKPACRYLTTEGYCRFANIKYHGTCKFDHSNMPRPTSHADPTLIPIEGDELKQLSSEFASMFSERTGEAAKVLSIQRVTNSSLESLCNKRTETIVSNGHMSHKMDLFAAIPATELDFVLSHGMFPPSDYDCSSLCKKSKPFSTIQGGTSKCTIRCDYCTNLRHICLPSKCLHKHGFGCLFFENPFSAHKICKAQDKVIICAQVELGSAHKPDSKKHATEYEHKVMPEGGHDSAVFSQPLSGGGTLNTYVVYHPYQILPHMVIRYAPLPSR